MAGANNTKTVDYGVLAEEVGLATLLQAHCHRNHRDRVSEKVLAHAQRVSENTPFQVILVARPVLDACRAGRAMALRGRFGDDAKTAMRLKRPLVFETLDELAEDDR